MMPVTRGVCWTAVCSRVVLCSIYINIACSLAYMAPWEVVFFIYS